MLTSYCHVTPTTVSLSFSPRRRRRRPPRRNIRRKPNPSDNHHHHSISSDNKLQFVLEIDNLKTTPLLSPLHRTLTFLDSKLNDLIHSSTEAYNDIRTLVSVVPGSNRVVVSCSPSTVWFLGGVVVWGFVAFYAVRVLVGLLGFGRSGGGGGGGGVEVVKRRDRSLGGREVVVATRRVLPRRDGGTGTVEGRGSLKGASRDSVRRVERKLPGWWPVVDASPVAVVGVMNREEYQREAKKLVQAIMDDKLSGKDVSEDDILDLRRICRKSGVRLSFGTENARDSLYRSAVHNVINTCCMASSPFPQIDGEDARVFLAALAHDFGLTALRAATIVSAGVAARTRLWFLQAWALEMQAKHSETVEELKKICLIHQIFPPEPFSPEMEMVARGLQRHLKLEQREFLLNKLVGVCGKESRRSAGEALGLV